MYLVAALFALGAVSLMAQPAIRTGGVVNAASFAPQGLQNGGVAQGSQFAVLGTNLGPVEPVRQTAFPYPTVDGLGGVTVKVSVGGVTADAIMVSAAEKKIVAVLPSTVPTGTGEVRVSYNGATATAPIDVVATNVGIFTKSGSNSGPGQIRNVADDGSATDNSLTAPARPGQRVAILGTGLGAVSGDEAAGPITGDIAGDIEVMFGAARGTVVSKGRAECCAGTDQIVVQIPDGVAGCFVSVAARMAGRTSNFATLSISPAGDCSDPGGFTASDFEKLRTQTEFSTGSISLGKSSVSLLGFETSSETAVASFSKFKVDGFLASAQFAGNPSIGSCVVSIITDTPTASVETQILDAGPSLTLTGPRGTRQLQKTQGVYSLGSGTPSVPGIPGGGASFLDPGDYTVEGPGGADVGAFVARINLGQPITWTNRATVGNSGPDVINRGSDVSVNWTGGKESDLVYILGSTNLTTPFVSAFFRCLERAPVGTFTVPSWILSAIPPSTSGLLSVGTQATDQNRFDVTGVDSGFISTNSNSSRLIAYQ
jgi:uncharacterized protein (TIGR03437 family)